MSANDIKLKREQIEIFLDKQKVKNLKEHYKFEEVIKCNFDSAEAAKNFLIANKPIKMEILDGQLYYTIDGISADKELFNTIPNHRLQHLMNGSFLNCQIVNLCFQI